MQPLPGSCTCVCTAFYCIAVIYLFDNERYQSLSNTWFCFMLLASFVLKMYSMVSIIFAANHSLLRKCFQAQNGGRGRIKTYCMSGSNSKVVKSNH